MSEKLSNIAKARSRTATGQFTPITTAQEARAEAKKPRPTIAGQAARIAELEAQITRLQVSNAPESIRLADTLRLAAEQGRDAAIESRDRFQADLVAANNRERSIAAHLARSEASEKKAHELLRGLTKEVDAQKAARMLAEGRYVALKRQWAGEWLITMAFIGLAVLPAVFIAGRYVGGLK